MPIIMMGTNVQSSPKISRFLALFGSLSLFTAHAMIPPRIPKKRGTRYQAPLTCCAALDGATLDMAIPLTGALTIWTDRSRLGHRPTATLAKHNGTNCLPLVKGRGGGRWDLNPRRPTPRVVSPTRPRLTTIVHDRFDHEMRE